MEERETSGKTGLAILDRRGVLLALLALHQKGPLTTEELGNAVGMTAGPIKPLRAYLEFWGLATVREEQVRGAVKKTTALTPLGERIAAKLAALDAALREANP